MDLILVRRNPLKRVKNLERLNGVMIDGRWLPQTELQELWENAVDNYPDVVFTAAAVGVRRVDSPAGVRIVELADN